MSDPGTPTPHQKRNQYLLGLGLGLIPLLVFLVLLGISVGSTDVYRFLGVGEFDLLLSGLLYSVAIGTMITCLFFKRVRFLGYGLMTAVIVSPTIANIGCKVILSIMSS
jgi:hypothetical protein